MRVIERSLEDLTPYRGNPRQNADAVAAVAESIRRFGFRQPLVVDRDDPVAFRRHFGAAEHWSNIALSLNPYDFENYHLHFRILWEKGERDEAIAWWRDTVLAREFWNPDLRNHLVDYCMANGDYSIARREAVFLRGGSKELRDFDAARRRRTARTATKGK